MGVLRKRLEGEADPVRDAIARERVPDFVGPAGVLGRVGVEDDVEEPGGAFPRRRLRACRCDLAARRGHDVDGPADAVAEDGIVATLDAGLGVAASGEEDDEGNDWK